MSDPFSAAGGAFAVLGAADVVLRASVECYRFLSDIKQAPADIERLRTLIKDNERLVNAIKQRLNDLRNDPSFTPPSTVDASQPLEAFKSAFRALQRELNSLQTLANRYTASERTWTRIKWRLDDKKLRGSLEKFDRCKADLGIALSLIQGKESAANQKKMEGLITSSFQQTVSQLKVQYRTLSTVRQTQDKLKSGQQRVILHSRKQLQQTAHIRKAIDKSYQTMKREHNMIVGKIAESNKSTVTAVSTVGSKLDELHAAILQGPRAANKSNRQIKFVGPDSSGISLPLHLIQPHLRREVLHIVSHHANLVSSEQMYWLLAEFDHLISSYAQEEAASYQGSTARPFDQWIYPRGRDIIASRRRQLGTSSPFVVSHESEDAESVVELRRTCRHVKFRFDTPVGRLEINVPRVSPEDTRDLAHIPRQARLAFIPSAGLCSTSIVAEFVGYEDPYPEPKLYAQLNAFRPVEREVVELYINLFERGSIAEIDAAFRNGTISPYAQGIWCSSLCSYFSGLYGRPDIVRYLDNQGVGPAALNSQLDLFEGFLISLDQVDEDVMIEMLSYLEDKAISSAACDYNEFPLTPYSSYWSNNHGERIEPWTRYLSRNGFVWQKIELSSGYVVLFNPTVR